jgi:antitoxin PrlF
LKGLDKVKTGNNLRDHMTDLELIFTMLGEASTTEIARRKDAQGLRRQPGCGQTRRSSRRQCPQGTGNEERQAGGEPGELPGAQALNLAPGCAVDFAVNRDGDVVIHKVGARSSRKPDRFEAARGKADVKWRTDELMALLRDD